MSALGLFLSVLVSGDAALTLPLPLQARDAIVARSMDDRQLHLFLPRDDGSFELRALPPLPSRVTSMVLVDADDDRDLDLALLLEDGQVEFQEALVDVMTEQVPAASRAEVERKCAELLDLLET